MKHSTRFVAHFVFQMPVLPGGCAVPVNPADRSRADHRMQPWMRAALAWCPVAPPIDAGGLVGLPVPESGLFRYQPAATVNLSEANKDYQHAHV